MGNVREMELVEGLNPFFSHASVLLIPIRPLSVWDSGFTQELLGYSQSWVSFSGARSIPMVKNAHLPHPGMKIIGEENCILYEVRCFCSFMLRINSLWCSHENWISLLSMCVLLFIGTPLGDLETKGAWVRYLLDNVFSGRGITLQPADLISFSWFCDQSSGPLHAVSFALLFVGGPAEKQRYERPFYSNPALALGFSKIYAAESLAMLSRWFWKSNCSGVKSSGVKKS